VGIITSFVAFAGLVTIVEDLRHWSHVYSFQILIAWFATALLLLLTVGYASIAGKRNREFERAINWREIADSPEAYALFKLLVFFAPEPVDENLLLRTRGVRAPTEELRRVLNDRAVLRRAVAELSLLSLAWFDKSGRIRVSRVAHTFARGQLMIEDPRSARSLERLVQAILAASDPGAPDKDETEEVYRRSRPHLIASGALESADPDVRELVVNNTRRLYRAGGFSEGVALGETALGLWEEIFDRDDRQTLALAVEVGTVLRRHGRWQAAMALNLDTLGRLRSGVGTDDQIYLLCARSHGIDLALFGDYSGALENDAQLLPLYERVFGRLDLETLQLRNNMAISLRCAGRFSEALEYDRHTYAMRRTMLDDEDTSTLTSRFAMARDLRMLGQVYQAHEMLAEVCSVLARNLSVSQQLRLVVAVDWAVSLRRCGHYTQALVQGGKVFRQHKTVYGPEHRETLWTGTNVINDLRIAGRLPDASKLGDETVAAWTSIVGADHPNTLAAQANLACVWREEGQPRAALQTDEQVVRKFTGLLGEAHPYTLAVMTNMASDLAMTGEAHRARQIGERSFELHVATRGRDHPYTLATAANLALDRRGDGDHAGADELHASTLRSCEGKLGAAHPEARQIARYERMTLDVEPMID
jgi:tetratricopeptide (TPR) repeat protein